MCGSVAGRRTRPDRSPRRPGRAALGRRGGRRPAGVVGVANRQRRGFRGTGGRPSRRCPAARDERGDARRRRRSARRRDRHQHVRRRRASRQRGRLLGPARLPRCAAAGRRAVLGVGHRRPVLCRVLRPRQVARPQARRPRRDHHGRPRRVRGLRRRSHGAVGRPDRRADRRSCYGTGHDRDANPGEGVHQDQPIASAVVPQRPSDAAGLGQGGAPVRLRHLRVRHLIRGGRRARRLRVQRAHGRRCVAGRDGSGGRRNRPGRRRRGRAP